MVRDYRVGYIKMDYNVDSLQGTDLHADSVGQGLLENDRAYLAWIDAILDRYPDLVQRLQRLTSDERAELMDAAAAENKAEAGKEAAAGPSER